MCTATTKVVEKDQLRRTDQGKERTTLGRKIDKEKKNKKR